MKLHPLINKDSTYYDTSEKSTIQELEKQLTVTEMIGFCKANIFKYEFRLEKKGQKESGLKKIETYIDYLEVLESLYDAGYAHEQVTQALTECMIEFRYR